MTLAKCLCQTLSSTNIFHKISQKHSFWKVSGALLDFSLFECLHLNKKNPPCQSINCYSFHFFPHLLEITFAVLWSHRFVQFNTSWFPFKVWNHISNFDQQFWQWPRSAVIQISTIFSSFFRKNRLCYQTLAARQNHLVYLVSLSGSEMSKLCFPMTIQLCQVLLEFIRKIFLIPIYAPCQIFLWTLQVISQDRTYQVQTAFSS